MITRRALAGAGAALIGARPSRSDAALGTYSEGWRMGRLDKFSLKGIVSYTGEGEVSLGVNSPRLEERDANGVVTKVLNPWAFSTERAVYERHEGLRGRRVALRYIQLQMQVSRLGGDTDYRVEEILPVAPQKAPASHAVADFDPERHAGDRSSGGRVGRIVKVTRKGTLAKTYELSMQAGDGTNTFVDMTIHDEGMYAAATAFLLSGELVAVDYRQSLLRNPLAGDTNYSVVRLTKADA